MDRGSTFHAYDYLRTYAFSITITIYYFLSSEEDPHVFSLAWTRSALETPKSPSGLVSCK